MLKLEFELDGEILEELGYDANGIYEIFLKLCEDKGLIKEKAENGYFLYRGKGLNTDLAYIAIVAMAIVNCDEIKPSCKKLLLLDNEDSKDGSFYVDSDWIKSAKKMGMW